MSDKPEPGPSLADEFQNLTNNLVQLMRNTWNSPERVRLQEDIESNLAELSSAIQTEVKSFQESESGQQLKADMHNLQEQIRSSEIPNKVRDEIRSALHVANQELQKVTEQWSPRSEPSQESPSAESGQGDEDVHPTD